MMKHLLCWMVVAVTGALFSAHAGIHTENMWGADTKDWDKRMRLGLNGGRMNRVGMATFEGELYYAFRNADNRVRVAAAKSVQTAIFPDLNDDACAFAEMGDTNWVVDLIPREGLLWLVQHGDESVLITAFKRAPFGSQLTKVRDLTILRPEGHPNASITGVATMTSAAGIYVHTFWNANGQCYLSHHLVQGDTVRMLEGSGLLSEAPLVRHPSLIDGVATQKMINVGTQDVALMPVHVIAYAGWDQGVRMVTFSPATSTREMAGTGWRVEDPDWAIISLVDGVLQGDPCTNYAVTLLEARRTGNGNPAVKAVACPINGGTWMFHPPQDVNLRFDGKSHLRENSMHWGIDKTNMRSTGAVQRATEEGTASFVSSMQQQFRLFLVTRSGKAMAFYTEEVTHFHSVTIDGNRFETLATPTSAKGIHVCDTSTGLEGLIPAWTLLGVVHGVPPYPRNQGGDFPSVSFTFSRSFSKEDSVTALSEDSQQYTFGVNFGGGDEYGAKKIGIFSWENSYSYGIKTEVEDSTSTTNTITTNLVHTFAPAKVSRSFLRQHPGEEDFDPASLGYLIYSCPVFATKSYAVRLWNNLDFADPGEFVSYLTAVDDRELRFFAYQLEHPERGPFYPTQNPDDTRMLAALSAGIDPVPPTSEIEKWKEDQSHIADDDREIFPSNVTISASRMGSSSFELSYLEETSTGHSEARSKSSSGQSHVQAGIKAIFNAEFTGEWGHSSTFTTTSRTTTTFGSAIGGTLPKLPEGQPVKDLTIKPRLIYPKDINKKVPWAPTAVSGSRPFLLTWKVQTVIQRGPKRGN